MFWVKAQALFALPRKGSESGFIPNDSKPVCQGENVTFKQMCTSDQLLTELLIDLKPNPKQSSQSLYPPKYDKKKNAHVYKPKCIDASLVSTLVLLDEPLGIAINLILLKEP